MARQFTVNTNRIDPYKNFKFILKFGDQTIAGVNKVSALKRSTEPVSHREGGDLSTPRHQPGATKYDPVTIEQGITHSHAFEEWANQVYRTTGDGAVTLKDFRKTLTIELLNLQGEPVRRYYLDRCWVSEYTALPELDANSNGIAFESIVIQYEGFERDEDLDEAEEF